MNDVTVRDLRNRGGHVLDRVSRGETVTITRNGKGVGELRPLDRTPLLAETILSRWHGLPKLDVDGLKTDIDRVLDSTI